MVNDQRNILKMKISWQFVSWHKEGRDLGDYKLRASFSHLRKLDPEWDTKYLEQLAGPHGWAIYKMLRVKHAKSRDTDNATEA